MSLLAAIARVDTLPYTTANTSYYIFQAHEGTAIGYLDASIAQHFEEEAHFTVDHQHKTVSLDSSLALFEARNEVFAATAARWRKLDEFGDSLQSGWRNELYTVYNPLHVPYLLVERAFLVLIGVVTYGIHVNGYVPANRSSTGTLKLWVPRRAKDKPTYPGMLDNMVAGGLGHPFGVWETLVKESYEEAGLDEEFVTKKAQSVGVLLYMYQPKGNDSGPVQPEVEYIFDVAFDDETSVVPQPVDGEAQDFTLMEVSEILRQVEAGQFKPNCGLVIVDFLVRHGVVTAESEPDYMEIVSRMHRRMPFPTQ